MPADRLLTTVLRAYQGVPDPAQTDRILGTTTSLLTTLTNPLNISLLTSHLLTAPAIWNNPDGLRICLRIISVFNTAAITVHKNEVESHNEHPPYDAYQPRKGGGIVSDDWARAVIKGADDRSPRWQHLLVIAGVLLGMENGGRHGLSSGLRSTLERALVTAANLALENPMRDGILAAESIVLALNHAFPLLSDGVRAGLNYDTLVMIMVRSVTALEGYQDGIKPNTVVYGATCETHRTRNRKYEQLSARNRIREHLLSFSGRLLEGWKRNKLSEIDLSEEEAFLTPETLQITAPVLWQVLKSAMFATVVILQGLMTRTVLDPILSTRRLAPIGASETLIILGNIHFISSRLGSNSFSAYVFVNLSSIDILSNYPLESRELLKAIYPTQAGEIPNSPLQRNHDLFYLNTCEHLTDILSPPDNESLIISVAAPYLNPTAHPGFLEIFEAAHSAVLAALSAPQNTKLTARFIPTYVDALFNSFPNNLSPRQFRYAFKSLIHITTPPTPLSTAEPMLAETLLEMLHHRATHAPTSPLPQSVYMRDIASQQDSQTPLSEQAYLMLTLLDALPNLPTIFYKHGYQYRLTF
ncbi:peroxin 8 [Botrytis cinerea]